MLNKIDLHRIQNEIQSRAYTFIPGELFCSSDNLFQDQLDLWNSWEDLKPDQYTKGSFKFRLRRYGRLLLNPDGQLDPLPHTHFYQSKENNSYAGGIKREFAPVHDSILNNRFLAELIHLDFSLLSIGDI